MQSASLLNKPQPRCAAMRSDSPRTAAPPTICKCGSAKAYHRPQDNRDHEYEPRYEPKAWLAGYKEGYEDAKKEDPRSVLRAASPAANGAEALSAEFERGFKAGQRSAALDSPRTAAGRCVACDNDLIDGNCPIHGDLTVRAMGRYETYPGEYADIEAASPAASGDEADTMPPPGYHFTESSDQVLVKDAPAASGDALLARLGITDDTPDYFDRTVGDIRAALAATPPLPEGLDVLDDEALVNRLGELESQKQAVHDEVRRRLQQPDSREGADWQAAKIRQNEIHGGRDSLIPRDTGGSDSREGA